MKGDSPKGENGRKRLNGEGGWRGTPPDWVEPARPKPAVPPWVVSFGGV